MNEGLTIFFPCFNDAATIGSLIAGAHLVGTSSLREFEVLVVDDGSTDSSRALLETLKTKYPELRTVYHEKNRGYGGAVMSGFQNARMPLVFYTDGDGQYDVLELSRLLPVLQDEIDVVNGYKISRSDPWVRILIGDAYVFVMRLLFGFGVRDVDCDFRLIRKRAVDSISLHHSSGVICLELVRKLELAGYRFAEFPVHHYHRVHGHSQFFNFRRLAVTALNILRLLWELRVVKSTPRNIAYAPETRVRPDRPGEP